MPINRKRNNDNHLVLKLGGSIVVAGLYFLGICFLSRYSYPNCLFFDPGFALFPAFLTGCIIIFSSFIATTQMIHWLKGDKKRVIIIILLLIIMLIFPIAFLKCGVVADEGGIYQKNIFGETVKEYPYSDIISFEMTVYYGIQYYIEFDSSESISLLSHRVPLNAFGNDHNMMVFDKILAQHAQRNIGYSYRIFPENTRRFFRDNEVFQYFDQILMTGDGSLIQGTVP